MRRDGTALLEALVALVLLSMAGVSVAGRVVALAQQRHLLEVREAEMAAAERLLTLTSFLDAAELDRRLGMRTAGPFVVLVGRPEAAVYRVSVSLAEHPDVELLATLVHRPTGSPSRAKEPAS